MRHNNTLPAQWADVAAVPFFALLVWYFLQIRRSLTVVEWLLLAFALAGLVLDSLFSVAFLASLSPPIWPSATRKTRAAAAAGPREPHRGPSASGP